MAVEVDTGLTVAGGRLVLHWLEKEHGNPVGLGDMEGTVTDVAGGIVAVAAVADIAVAVVAEDIVDSAVTAGKIVGTEK